MSNTNPLQLLRSSTANKRPLPAGLVDGRPAINTNSASPGLFFKDSTGGLVKVGPVHVGTTAPNVSPASGGATGNSVGEQWLDTTGGTYVLKIWDGSAWRSESGTFVDVNGDVMTGALVMDNQQQVRFRETTANGTNYIALQAPASVASDKTITLPDVNGTVITTGDSQTVTSTMIRDDTIVNADINSSAAIAGTKISPNFGSQNVTTTGTSTAASFIPTSSTVPTNGVYLPAANSVALSTNGTGKLFIDTNGNVTLTGAGTGTRYLALLNETSTYAGSYVLQAGGGSAGFGGAITMYGHSHATYPGSVYIGTSAGSGGSIILGTNNALDPANEKLRITSAGLVGVGTSSPSHALTVNGAISSLTGVIRAEQGANAGFVIGSRSAQTDFQLYNTGNVLRIYNGTSDALNIDTAGNVGIGTSTPSQKLTSVGNIKIAGAQAANVANLILTRTDTSWSINNETDLRFYRGTGDTDSPSTASVAFTNTGNVGIGTSSPTSLLHVDSAPAGTQSARTLLSSSNSADTVACEIRQGRFNKDVLVVSSNQSLSANLFNAIENGTSRFVITGAGNVGIGTTDAGSYSTYGNKLVIYGTGTNGPGMTIATGTSDTGSIYFADGTTGNQVARGAVQYAHADDALLFQTAATERFRCDSSGRLLVGTSSARSPLTHNPSLQVEGLGYEASTVSVITNSNDTNGAYLFIGKSRGTSLGSNTIVQSGDEIGGLDFIAADGTQLLRAARITALVDGTLGTNDMPGRLVFSVTADGASSPTEALRITSSQDLLLSQSGSGFFVGTTTDGAYRIGRSSYAVSTGTLYIGNAAIQVSSDVRLKDNIEDTSLDALEVISNIKVKDFTWNDPSDTSYNNRNARGKWTGLIAQELVDVLPFVVNAPRKEDGSIDHDSDSIWTLDQSQLCPVLIKAVQQQQEIIAALEARLTAAGL